MLASPVFSTKLACFSEKRAPPTAQAAAAGGLEQLARGAAPGALVLGVLEGRAEGLDPGGLRLAAPLPHLGQGGADLRRVAGLEPEAGAGDDLARARGWSCGRRSRAAPGARRSVPGGGADVDPLEHPRQLAAVGVGVHPHRAARGAGMLIPNSRPERPQPAAFAAAEGSRAPPPQTMRSPSRSIAASSPSSLIASPRNPSSATSRFDPEPITPTARPSSAAQREQLQQRVLARRGGRSSRRGRRCGPWSGAPAGRRARRPAGVAALISRLPRPAPRRARRRRRHRS